MASVNHGIQDFLAQKRIGIAGVSRNGHEAANLIYRKLRAAGYEVFAINPNAQEVEGAPCHPNLKAITGGVDAVVIATHPQATDEVVRECVELRIPAYGCIARSDRAVSRRAPSGFARRTTLPSSPADAL